MYGGVGTSQHAVQGVVQQQEGSGRGVVALVVEVGRRLCELRGFPAEGHPNYTVLIEGSTFLLGIFQHILREVC